MQDRFLDCTREALRALWHTEFSAIGVESAGFPGQSSEEIDRLLHMIVVGGGPTGVELRSFSHSAVSASLGSNPPLQRRDP